LGGLLCPNQIQTDMKTFSAQLKAELDARLEALGAEEVPTGAFVHQDAQERAGAVLEQVVRGSGTADRPI